MIPVQVIEPVVKTVKQRDPAAILPSKAVRLRENPKKKPRSQNPPEPAAAGLDKLNQTLGKPYVLWPICVTMLVAALLVGLYLQGDRNEPALPIVEGPEPVQVTPVDQSLTVALNVFPNSVDAKLTVAGEPRELDDLKLEPGQYEIVVEKAGFEPFVSAIEIDKDNTAFDIALKELATEEVTTQPEVATEGKQAVTPKVEEPTEPVFVDVRISLFPTDAELLVDGQPIKLNDGKLRLAPEETQRIELAASAEGYQSRTVEWSMAEIINSKYDLELLLEKLPTVKPEATLALPKSLVPKPETQYDDETGLPHRCAGSRLESFLAVGNGAGRGGNLPIWRFKRRAPRLGITSRDGCH